MPKFRIWFEETYGQEYEIEAKDSTDARDKLYDDLFKNEKYWLGSGLLVAKKVIFNPPATIVIWEDGTKTIVKCMEGDTYDAEKGLALCYMKKACEYYGFSYQKELKRAKDWTKSVIPAEVLEGDFVKRMFDIIEKNETERRNYETRTSTD